MAKKKNKKNQKKRGSGKIAFLLSLLVIGGALLYRGQQNGALNVTEAGSSIVSVAEEWLGRLRAEELFATLTDRGGGLPGTLREKGGELIATLFGFERQEQTPDTGETVYTLDNLPDYSGTPYVELEGNRPDFAASDLTTTAYEVYSPLDLLGRCGETRACVGPELMPTEERGAIGMVKPSGWHTVRYDDRIDGNYLYNRCHLIGYQLSGENANEMNLITGTRYLNVVGMLPFENAVADYVQDTGNHVMYRVTPIFHTVELVARGVQMEAYSVEDEGAGICFNVYCYNVQPGVVIDYLTGESRAEEGYTP